MVAIFTPARDLVHAGFTYDLAQLLRFQRGGEDVVFALAQGTLLNNLRTQAVKTALGNGMTHLLFLDSDMRFPPDTATRLLAHRLPVVGANYRSRTQDGWTARPGKGPLTHRGVEAVRSIGLGCALLDLAIFRHLALPWFDMPWDAAQGKHVGEDIFFCAKVSLAGHAIYVDHDLSRQVRHAKLVELGAEPVALKEMLT